MGADDRRVRVGYRPVDLALCPVRRGLTLARNPSLNFSEPRRNGFSAGLDFPRTAPCANRNRRSVGRFLNLGNANLCHQVTRVALKRDVERTTRVEMVRLSKVGDPHEAMDIYTVRELFSGRDRYRHCLDSIVRREEVTNLETGGAIRCNGLGTSRKDPRTREPRVGTASDLPPRHRPTATTHFIHRPRG